MSLTTQKEEASQEEVPITRLVRAKDIATPEVHTWQLIDLEQEEKQRELKIRSEVYQQIQRELQPQITRQTAILKREAYEEAKQAGYEDGYQAGFETGQTQGLEKAQLTATEELSPKVASLEGILAALAEPQALIEQAVFQQVADIALMLAERLVNQTIQVHPEKIIDFVKEAVALLPEEEARIDVELHPNDYEIVLYYQQQHSTKWHLIAKESIAVGTCRVKRLNSVVNHDWKKRLDTLLQDSKNLLSSIADSPVDSKQNDTSVSVNSNIQA